MSYLNHKLIYIENNQLSERIVNNNSNMSLIVYNNGGGSYFTVLYDSYLDNAVFTKLYLESGMNTTRFNLTHTEPGISVWNVFEYPTGNTNQAQAVVNKTNNTNTT